MAPVISKVVIFGATGNTGLATVENALKKGYEVTAFVRDANKLSASVKPTNIIVGDVLNKSDVQKAVENEDAVIICLGTRNDLSPTTALSEGTKNIVDAMNLANVKRVSCCISSFLFWDRSKVPEKFIPLTLDHERMLNVLKGSDREWIAVMPPHIEETPARGDYTLKNDGPVGRNISKYDLAEILVNCLTDDTRVGHTVGMGYVSA